MLNRITIMGRLTRDPELRYTQSQTAVASFTVAVDRDYSGQNGGQKQTDFIDCVAWRSTGEFVNKYFAKGSMAVVTGRLQLRDWTDNNGVKRRVAEVVADNVYFGESRRDQSYSNGYSNYSNQGYATPQYSGAYPTQQQQYPTQQETYYQPSFQELDDSDGELPF